VVSADRGARAKALLTRWKATKSGCHLWQRDAKAGHGRSSTPKRPRGRPPSPLGAKSKAEVQRAYRERQKAARVPPEDIVALHEQAGRQALTITRLQQDVARLTARNTEIEAELRRVEQHNLRLLKDIIVLKQAAATPPVRGKARAK
jgi:hypothetical protein